MANSSRGVIYRIREMKSMLLPCFFSVSMERLPTLQYQLIGEFHTLLEYPACSVISRSNLLQMMAINIFAIGNTAAQGSS